jgi:hypothetical protein
MAERPTAGDVWAARLRRAGGLTAPTVRDLYFALLTVIDGEGPKFAVVDGRWAENPHYGDETFYLAEQRRLWKEIGRRLGIGPPLESFHQA